MLKSKGLKYFNWHRDAELGGANESYTFLPSVMQIRQE